MAKRQVLKLEIDPRLCKGTEGCSICMDRCEEKVLAPAPALSARGVHPAAVMALAQCTGCELCVIHCPDLAINLVMREAVPNG